MLRERLRDRKSSISCGSRRTGPEPAKSSTRKKTSARRALLRQMEGLAFKELEFQGFLGKRRAASFGWRYDFNGGRLSKTQDMPEFLGGLGARAEAFAGNAPGSFQQVLVTEYRPGSGIGWHKNRSVFGDVSAYPAAHRVANCVFRKFPDRVFGNSRTAISVIPGQGFR